jgi:hypothetical protein
MSNAKTMTREQGAAAIKIIMSDPRFDDFAKSYVKTRCSYPDASTIIYAYGDTSDSDTTRRINAINYQWVDEIFRNA